MAKPGAEENDGMENLTEDTTLAHDSRDLEASRNRTASTTGKDRFPMNRDYLKRMATLPSTVMKAPGRQFSINRTVFNVGGVFFAQ